MAIAGESVTMYQEVSGRVLESRVERARRAGTRIEIEIVPFAYRSSFEMARAGEILVLSELDTGREILFERLDSLPERTERTADPTANFEYFLALVADLYPAFGDRGVDWPAVSARLRSRAHAAMDESELFALCREALDAIGRDGHIGMTGPGEERYSPARRHASPMIGRASVERQLALIRDVYLDGEFHEAANGKIFYGRLGDIGYVNVLAVESMAADSSVGAQRRAVEAALDEVHAALADATGVVLDLRHNGGGFDALALAIAGLFADREYVAFGKRVRIQGTERFTEPRLFPVSPREKSLAGKPLLVLTGPGTASGAEILVMATLPLSSTRRMGAPTMGILSDTFMRELPNGWMVRLYSERYYTFDGGTYEATGLPPDVPVDYGIEDVERGVDTVLEGALRALGSAPNPC
jgi:hypothetical protein